MDPTWHPKFSAEGAAQATPRVAKRVSALPRSRRCHSPGQAATSARNPSPSRRPANADEQRSRDGTHTGALIRSPPVHQRALRLVLAIVAALVLTADADGRVSQGPAGPAFYTPPTPIPGGEHGALIWARPLTGSAALAGARNTLVLYRSTGLAGQPVAVSGVVSVPRRRPPRGGWPVITYAHGSTGIADQCAPSRDSPSNPAHDDDDYVYPLLDRWIRDGFAVLHSDEAGLGTPGIEPYDIGETVFGASVRLRTLPFSLAGRGPCRIWGERGSGPYDPAIRARMPPLAAAAVDVVGKPSFVPPSAVSGSRTFMRNLLGASYAWLTTCSQTPPR